LNFTKAELIEALKDFPDDMEIILSVDGSMGGLKDIEKLINLSDVMEYILLVGAT